MQRKALVIALVAAGLAAPFAARATDGYFSHAYGTKALGMGGAGVALAEEPFGGAVNPATMTMLGNQWQGGATWFSPKRSAERTGSGMAGIDGSVSSDSKNFLVPEFGLNRMLRPDLAVGVSVFGNGGMNTDFEGGQVGAMSACAVFNPTPGPYNLLCGNGRLGVDLSQLMIAPYAAMKLSPQHSVGIAPVIAYQRFRAQGLQAFDNPFLSTAPGSVTNRGYDDAWGFGARLGWAGQFGPVTLAAAYATKVRMQEFDKYKGLFAEAGGFDIPSNWTIGLAWKPDAKWTIAADFERINYSDSKSVSNPATGILACFGGDANGCLGAGGGAGFGWQDIDVWKVGVQYAIDARWTVRAGVNRSDNPIQARDVTFNILAPGVIKDHVTAGFTYKLDATSEISGYVLQARENTVSGTSLLASLGAPPTTAETIRLKETSIGLAYTARY
ncbi:MAG TPA: outer membrane protein transport protein [Usitatibacteraceae bacterium]|nr:outer membrane protein transport protein [Usitatibacteraceae bacterium]